MPALLAAIMLTLLCGCDTANYPQSMAPAARPVMSRPIVAQNARPPVAAAPAPLSVQHAAHVKVALLLPLTGASAQLGRAMMDAANLAVFDLSDKSFELIPEDTGDTAEGARKAAEMAVAARADLILGPLFSSSIAPVRAVAKSAGINVISFSTDTNQAGDNVLVMGFLPETQVRRVLQYAKGKGMARIAVIAPEGAYGDAALAALKQDADPVAVARYPASTLDFGPQYQVVKGAGDVSAILIPEGGDKLRAIAGGMAAGGLDPAHVKLLGTGLWDDVATGKEPALVGGWYAGTIPTARADFEKRFNATYHYAPARLATLAYDATALAVVLGKQGVAGAAQPYALSALEQPTGFAGVDGVFRFRDNGAVERRLSVLQVGPNGPTVIDAGAKSFTPGM